MLLHRLRTTLHFGYSEVLLPLQRRRPIQQRVTLTPALCGVAWNERFIRDCRKVLVEGHFEFVLVTIRHVPQFEGEGVEEEGSSHS